MSRFTAETRRHLPGVLAALTLAWSLCASPARANLGPADLLVLVNGDSPVSRSTATLYRTFYNLSESQILYLYGLPDCASTTAGPNEEIITRSQFDTLIAQPVRNYLLTSGMVNTVYCIVTTAGMPYRIEDTDATLANVIMPAASDYSLVSRRTRIDAASVESDLAVLWQIDPALPTSTRMSLKNRLVNPYQGYRSGIKSWSNVRDMLNRRNNFRWTYVSGVYKGPNIEGTYSEAGFSAVTRVMSPADIYLVARLDAPRPRGKMPIFNIKRMLQRSAAVSNPKYLRFQGYNPWTSVVAFDYAPTAPAAYDHSYTINVPSQLVLLSWQGQPIPPGAELFSAFNEADHYRRGFDWLTGGAAPMAGGQSWEVADSGLRGIVMWDDTSSRVNSSMLFDGLGVLGLFTYGCNGGDGRPASYLTTGGPTGGQLVNCVAGAVFSSLESFNAVTFFSDQSTGQGKIADFIGIGGSGAIGHVFEPGGDAGGALIQPEFLMWNYLKDDDQNGVGDLTFVEAATSAMPYVSWAEVIVGDPLMRLNVGPGGYARNQEWPGDSTDDGKVNILDQMMVQGYLGYSVGQSAYRPGYDLNEDGIISQADLDEVLANMGRRYE